MNDNPFSKILDVLKEDKKSSFFYGKVTGDKQITTNGIKLYKEDLEKIHGIELNFGDRVFLYDTGDKVLILGKVVDL